MEGNGGGGAAALFSARRAGVIDEGEAHQAGAGVVEMKAVLVLVGGLGGKLEEELIDEGGGLPGVARALAAEDTTSEFAQARVDDRSDAIESRGVASGPGVEGGGDVGHDSEQE